METTELLSKLKFLREKYTFKDEKYKVFAWEKAIRGKLVRADVVKYDGIKELITELAKMINEITYSLAWDKTLTEDQRKDFFLKRESWMWLLSFFAEPSKYIINLEKKVANELKHIRQ